MQRLNIVFSYIGSCITLKKTPPPEGNEPAENQSRHYTRRVEIILQCGISPGNHQCGAMWRASSLVRVWGRRCPGNEESDDEGEAGREWEGGGVWGERKRREEDG